ncbi:MAG: phosphatase PAP2 family protein [Acidobacteria bacterium]|nr:MAG: phosphatase PAP2 family protein [Acidobacteriota bacterium]
MGLNTLRALFLRATGRLLSHEPVVLITILLIILGIWLFVGVTEEVIEADTQELDERVLLALRASGHLEDPIGPPWLERMAAEVTALGGIGPLSLFTMAVAGFLWLNRKRAMLLLVLISVGGGACVSFGLKQLIGRPRPSAVPHLTVVSSASFPSGHAFLSAVVYLTVGILLAATLGRRRLKLYILFVAILLTFLIGISRVYLGVHYPTDVLGGWTGGLVWALSCWVVARRLQKRGAVEAEEDPSPEGE